MGRCDEVKIEMRAIDESDIIKAAQLIAELYRQGLCLSVVTDHISIETTIRGF